MWRREVNAATKRYRYTRQGGWCERNENDREEGLWEGGEGSEALIAPRNLSSRRTSRWSTFLLLVSIPRISEPYRDPLATIPCPAFPRRVNGCRWIAPWTFSLANDITVNGWFKFLMASTLSPMARWLAPVRSDPSLGQEFFFPFAVVANSEPTGNKLIGRRIVEFAEPISLAYVLSSATDYKREDIGLTPRLIVPFYRISLTYLRNVSLWDKKRNHYIF